MKNTRFENWGTICYEDAFKRQRELFDKNISAKLNRGNADSCWIFCEHLPVITLGKHGDSSNLLYSEEMLREKGVALFRTERGGDVTFHGPGQLVSYPIWDLEALGFGLRSYICFLEEVVIRTISTFGLVGERIDGASGVWLGKGTSFERKICAIGVKSSRFITMHGMALNVNTNLSYFTLINPCGFTDKGVTSLEKETGKKYDIEEIQKLISKHVVELLNCDIFL